MFRGYDFGRPLYSLQSLASQPSDESLGYYQSSAKRGLAESLFGQDSSASLFFAA
jgi:hypothetical protein